MIKHLFLQSQIQRLTSVFQYSRFFHHLTAILRANSINFPLYYAPGSHPQEVAERVYPGWLAYCRGRSAFPGKGRKVRFPVRPCAITFLPLLPGAREKDILSMRNRSMSICLERYVT